jgi:hypothetical protein
MILILYCNNMLLYKIMFSVVLLFQPKLDRYNNRYFKLGIYFKHPLHNNMLFSMLISLLVKKSHENSVFVFILIYLIS